MLVANSQRCPGCLPLSRSSVDFYLQTDFHSLVIVDNCPHSLPMLHSWLSPLSDTLSGCLSLVTVLVAAPYNAPGFPCPNAVCVGFHYFLDGCVGHHRSEILLIDSPLMQCWSPLLRGTSDHHKVRVVHHPQRCTWFPLS